MKAYYLMYANETTPKDRISVVKGIKTMEEVEARFKKLDKETSVEFAYVRCFDELDRITTKWLRRNAKEKA